MIVVSSPGGAVRRCVLALHALLLSRTSSLARTTGERGGEARFVAVRIGGRARGRASPIRFLSGPMS